MLIDKYCPVYITSSKDSLEVNASIENVYPVVHSFSIANSRLVKVLLRLRGFPEHFTTLEGLKKFGFVILGDVPFQEIAFGIVGKFWTYSADVQRLSVESFDDFQREGFAKAVANITFKKLNSQKTCVATETRVYCFDKKSAFYFRLYWTLIAPFSRLIRRKWLETIKSEAERSL